MYNINFNKQRILKGDGFFSFLIKSSKSSSGDEITMTEVEQKLQGLNNRFELAEEKKMSRLEDRTIEIVQAKEQREKRTREAERNLRNVEHH